ncbi:MULTISPECIES: hypothetical protein [unclassified Achromobacter]|uniref:hypothetical protein n=1 Tax=unclassified Achromobacter TaxID=2626865 RepID=UPI000B5196FB|nr:MULTISPECIES: hypothetical protein [unclassified Achromobacter]OWT77016.1 hypothetical protein CEY04_13530 [Achromobacter sp. HZ28]OWT77897.1 hypothetical protein CEY05_08025 [Achromobacter sp. HZ34]
MTDNKSNTERRAALAAAMEAAGCTDPKSWVDSELSEDIPQFARFLLLQEVHRAADAVEVTVSEALFDRPDLEVTLKTLRSIVAPDALNELLLAYGKALGNTFVMALDHGPQDDDVPRWQLMETDAEGKPTGRLVQGLHEDYLDFEDSYERDEDLE